MVPHTARAMRRDWIHLRGLRFWGFHGVYDWERRAGQRFWVDLSLAVDMERHRNREADDVGNTVDYGAVYGRVRELVEDRDTASQLIEQVGMRIVDDVLETFPMVQGVRVVVKKPDVQLGGPLDHAAVEMERYRCESV